MINKQKGVTALELLLVIAMVGVIFSIALPSFNAMRNQQLLKATTLEVSSSINKARSQTLASVNSSEYGIHFQSDQIVIFRGQTYSSGDSNNEYITLTTPAFISDINLAGSVTDIYFNRLSGAPNTTGTITISVSSLSQIITISATGIVSID